MNTILVIYWLLIFEGALRKWGAPELRNVFYFIRVPVTLFLYWIALAGGRWPMAHAPFVVGGLLSVVALPIFLIQFVYGGYSTPYLLVGAVGWMNYFFFIPLAFIIGEQFGKDDLIRLIRHSFGISILVAPLIVVQFYSNPTSVFNVGSGIDDESKFKILLAVAGYARPTGLFSSSLGQAYFTVSVGAMLLYVWLSSDRQKIFGRTLPVLASLSVLIMAAFSGSRTIFFMFGILVLATVVGGVLTGRKALYNRIGLFLLSTIAVGLFLWPVFFPTAFDVFTTRWENAQASELQTFQFGILGRALYSFYGFLFYLVDLPPFGYLLGIGGGAARQLSWISLPDAARAWSGYGSWAEDGWSRHIVELGPFFGLIFILYRVWLTIWLGRLVVKSLRRFKNLLPMLLFGFVAFIILNAAITGQVSANGYAWMFVGFTIAAARNFSSHRVIGARMELSVERIAT